MAIATRRLKLSASELLAMTKRMCKDGSRDQAFEAPLQISTSLTIKV